MGSAMCGKKIQNEAELPTPSSRLITPIPPENPEPILFFDKKSEHEMLTLVEISIKCSGLITENRFQLLNPVVHVLVEENGEFVKRADTETLFKTLNPVFSTKVKFVYSLGLASKLKFEVYDYQVKSKTKEHIGSCIFSLHEISVKTSLVSKELYHNGKKVGYFGLIAKELNMLYDTITMQWEFIPDSLQGYCILRLARDDLDSSFIIFQTEARETPYKWEEFTISVNRLCKGDEIKDITVEVVRLEGFEEVIFTNRFNLQTLKSSNGYICESTSYPGKLGLSKFNYVQKPSFLQYIHSGYEISTIYAIDFSCSQGHDSKLENNQYMKTLTEIQSALQYYTLDPLFLVFGIGGLFTNMNKVSNFFAITGNIFQPGVLNVNMALDYYRSTSLNVIPANVPRHSELIRNIYKQIKFEIKEAHRYYMLTILCGEDTIDPSELKTALECLIEYPVTIIFIGILTESRSYDNLQQLALEISSSARREFVIFAPYNEYMKSLNDLSKHLLNYCLTHNFPLKIRPPGPRSVRSNTVSNKILVERIKIRNSYYLKCKQEFTEHLFKIGLSKEKVEEITQKGVPYFFEDSDISSPLDLPPFRSKTMVVKSKPSNFSCASCKKVVARFAKSPCGCENVCNACVGNYKCLQCGS
ncbi:hypothetical protein SteCoe_10349 [Stentor coeruleus]|uniref:C2 domain-containing protein n=1 Tax=Stentor coeruleus TaxID=5963 RepID=A0A1R2CFT6_9CILI|nr:hypothetical protein SteCoe_10349 [Stentor coeruleus]